MKQKGKNYRPKPLPYIRDNQKSDRVTWAREMKKMLGEEKSLVFFLDKKWFYTTGIKRRLKHLPRGPPQTGGRRPCEITKSAQPPLSCKSDVHGGCQKTYPLTCL